MLISAVGTIASAVVWGLLGFSLWFVACCFQGPNDLGADTCQVGLAQLPLFFLFFARKSIFSLLASQCINSFQ